LFFVGWRPILFISPQNKVNADVVRDFVQEVRVQGRLRHHNVVPLLGVCLDRDNQSLVSPFLSGGSLFDALGQVSQREDQRKSQLAGRVILRLLRGVAIGMQYLHSFRPPILHRDLKSQNVLLDENKEAKLTDFGLARSQSDSGTMTATGTMHWCAPEVLARERYSEKADVYSFAVLATECLDSKRHPYDGVKVFEIAFRVVHEQLRPSVSAALWNAELKALVEVCWQDEPDNRPSYLPESGYTDSAQTGVTCLEVQKEKRKVKVCNSSL
jgi:serine/threonine protein kinase